MRSLILLLVLVPIAMTSSDAQEPDSARLALANQLLDVTRYDTQVERMAAFPSSETAKAHRQFRIKYLTPDVLRPPLARRIAELYTEPELRELIAFFETPVGQKWIDLQPRHSEALGPAIAEIYRKHGAEFQEILLRGASAIPPRP